MIYLRNCRTQGNWFENKPLAYEIHNELVSPCGPPFSTPSPYKITGMSHFVEIESAIEGLDVIVGN